jgi:hypothetical protein
VRRQEAKAAAAESSSGAYRCFTTMKKAQKGQMTRCPVG